MKSNGIYTDFIVALIIISSILGLILFFWIMDIITKSKVRKAYNTESYSSIEKQHLASRKKDMPIFNLLIILPFILIWILTIVTRNVVESELPRVLHLVVHFIRVSLWTAVLLLFFMLIHELYEAFQFIDKPFLPKMKRMLQIRRRCSSGTITRIYKFPIILLILLLTAWYFVRSDLILPLSALVFWNTLWQIKDYISPLTILLLGISQERTHVLQSAITSVVNNALVISLLNSEGYWHQKYISSKTFRALTEEDWKSIVLEFCKLAKIIVLDGRELNPNVEIEVSILSRSEFSCRTFIVFDEKSQSKALLSVVYKQLIQNGARIMSVEGLNFNLRGVLGLRQKQFSNIPGFN